MNLMRAWRRKREGYEAPSAVPEVSSDPSFKLVDKEMQYWAMGLWCLALPIMLYGMHRPMSCTELSDEQARMPSQCDGIVGHVEELRLPDFCWQPCAQYLPWSTTVSACFAVIMQAVVVLFNHDGCNKFLLLRWYFDLTDLLGGGQNPTGVAKWRHPILALREAGLRSVSKKDAMSLAPAFWVSKVSTLCSFNAFCQLCFFLVISLPTESVFFECTGKDGKPLHVEQATSYNYYEITSLAVSWVLVGIIVWLVGKARWTVQLGLTFGDTTEFERQFHRMVQPTGYSRFFPKQKKPGDEHEALKAVFLMELILVEQDGELFRPSDVGNLTGDVTLHFHRAKPKSRSREAFYRKRGMAGLFFSALTLGFASSNCWVCVSGLRALKGSAAFQLDKRLMLMGACGRHHGTGSPCWMACAALLLAWLQQLVIAVSDKVRERGMGVLEMPDADEEDMLDDQPWDWPAEQLSVNLVDMRRNFELNPRHYEQAGLTTMPSVQCHIWVVPASLTSNGREEPVDCQDLAADRKQWERSSAPRTVAICFAPDAATLKSWTRGLLREDFNAPTHCIEFIDKQKRMKQVVPPEFIAGHFHAWVGLGPKAAWEDFSMALAIAALCSAMFDFVAFFVWQRTGMLSGCHEVLTKECVYFHVSRREVVDQRAIEYHASLGPYVTACGILGLLYGIVGLRVARDVQGCHIGPEEESCTACVQGCPCLYLVVFAKGIYHLGSFMAQLAYQLVGFTVNSLWRRLFGRKPKPKLARARRAQISVSRDA